MHRCLMHIYRAGPRPEGLLCNFPFSREALAGSRFPRRRLSRRRTHLTVRETPPNKIIPSVRLHS